MNKYHKIFNRSTRRTGGPSPRTAPRVLRTADLRHSTAGESQSTSQINHYYIILFSQLSHVRVPPSQAWWLLLKNWRNWGGVASGQLYALGGLWSPNDDEKCGPNLNASCRSRLSPHAINLHALHRSRSATSHCMQHPSAVTAWCCMASETQCSADDSTISA